MQNHYQRKRALLGRIALLTALTIGWLVTSPAIAAATATGPPRPLGHTRTLSGAEMNRIWGGLWLPGQTGVGDASGPPPPWQAATATGVCTDDGNKLTGHPIVSWTQRGGMPIDLTLSHNSIGASNGTIGVKWTHSYNVYLVLPQDPNTSIQVVFGDGYGETFTQNVNGTYSAPTGIWDTLVANTNGTYTLTRKNLSVWTFKSNGWLSTIADKSGNTTTLAYSTSNVLQTVTDATGRALTFTFNSTTHQFTSVSDPLGRAWSFAYDSSGNLSSITDPPYTGTSHYSTTFSYDSSNRITQVTDRRGNNWTYSYNSSSQLVWEKTPLLQETTYTYGTNTTTVTDPRGNTQVYNYNSAGNLSSEVDEAGDTESYAYDSNHDNTQVTDKRGYIWNYTFDSTGDQLTAENPLSETTTWTYNAKYEPLTVTDPLSNVTTNTYDSNGNQLTSENPLSQTTTYTIGTYGLISTKTDSLSKATGYTYSTNGDLLTVTTPGSKVTTWTYNSLGVPTSKTDNLGRVETDTLDGLYRKTGASYSGGTISRSNETWTYDGENELTQFTDTTGTTSRVFDAQHRITSETTGAGTVTYAYDGTIEATTGRLISLTDPASRTLAYTYTTRGQLATVVNNSTTTTYTYDADENETATTNPNGTTVAKVYDDSGQLSSLTNENSTAVVLSSFDYAYRSDGRKSSVTEADGSVDSWTYDNAGRLTSESRTGTDPFSASYTLNSEAVRTSQTIGSATTSFTYDGDYALTAASSTTGGLNNSYSYNAAGDQTGRTLAGTSYSLAYDSKGQLGTTTVGTSTTTFGYDAQGRRVSRNAGGTTTAFVRSGDANGGQVLDEVQSGTVTAAYTYGNALIEKGSSTFLADGQGSVRQTTSSSQAVTASSIFDGFGNTVASSGTAPVQAYQGTAGYRTDGDAGLMQVGARHYDPEVGLFTSRDSYLSQKPYLYCEHDPINANDPSGHVARNPNTHGIPTRDAQLLGGIALIAIGIVLAPPAMAAGATAGAIGWGIFGLVCIALGIYSAVESWL